MKTLKESISVWIKIFLIIDCLAIILIWPIDVASGAYPNGLFSYQDGNIPVFHLLAEFIMALVTLAGIWGWAAEKSWGKPITLLGIGMLVYSSVNSLGWAIKMNTILAYPMVITIFLAIMAIPYLLPRRTEATGE